MEDDNAKLIESLLERVTYYGKTTYELVKLKALDKTTDAVSSFIPHSFVLALIAIFMLFANLGLALYLGEIFGKVFYGFLVVAAFYGIMGMIIHFFMHKWIKKLVSNYIIKQLLK